MHTYKYDKWKRFGFGSGIVQFRHRGTSLHTNIRTWTLHTSKQYSVWTFGCLFIIKLKWCFSILLPMDALNIFFSNRNVINMRKFLTNNWHVWIVNSHQLCIHKKLRRRCNTCVCRFFIKLHNKWKFLTLQTWKLIE